MNESGSVLSELDDAPRFKRSPRRGGDGSPRNGAEMDVLKWQENREQSRNKMEYQRAMFRLHELIDGNRLLPANLTSVHFSGVPNIREGFLASIVEPHLTSVDDSTLEDLLKTTSRLCLALEKTDAFAYVLPTLKQSTSIYASPNDMELHLKLKERSRFIAKTSTEVGNNEGSASITATIRSVLGGAETLSGNISFGTRTRRAFLISMAAPLVSVDPKVNTWGHLSVFSRESDFTYSSSCFVREEGMSTRLTKDMGVSKHELGYEAVVRNVGNLAPNASISMREDAGSSIKSALSHTWTYGDDPSAVDGTRGYYMKSIQELAGTVLGGDASHYKSITECQLSRRLAPGLSLSMSGRAGFLYPFGGTRTLFPDRLFLGGASNVRMFRERGMGPHDKGDTLGGELMWASGLSLIGDIPRKSHWPIKWQTFVNVGRLDHYNPKKSFTSQVESSLKQPSVSVGLGLVYKFDPVRVEVNFGMPLVQSKGEQGRRGLQVGVGVEFL